MTNTHPGSLDGDPLAGRLWTLQIPVPEHLAELGTRRRWSRGGPGHRRRQWRRVGWGTLAAATSAAALLLNGAASYLIPGYAQALAATPVLGAITAGELQLAGLPSTQIQPQSGTATADGVTVTVVGAAADPVRTTVFVRVPGQGRCDAVFSHMYLTQSGGANYPLTSSDGCPSSAFAQFFAPLQGLAAGQKVALTLHIPLRPYYLGPGPGSGNQPPLGTPNANPQDWHPASGTLAIPFSVTMGSAMSLATPAPVASGGTDYAVTKLTQSGNALVVQTAIQGQLIDRLNACWPATGSKSCGSGEAYPGVYLVSPSGQRTWPTQVLASSLFSAGDGPPPAVDRETRLFPLIGAGAYRLVIQWSSGPGPYTSSEWGTVQAAWTVMVP